MRMVSTLYTFQIVVVVSMVWGPSHAVIELTCGSNIILNTSSATTYRFGDYINPYSMGLSCDFDFSLSDANEKILFQVFPQCTKDADVLKINNGPNACCDGCQQPISAPSNAFQVSLTTDTTSGPKELGFVIRIATGKDESRCPTSSPSPIIVSVGSSPVIITSPGFPNKYPTFSDCRYTINPHDSSKGLSFTFDVISLDYFDGCYDKIQLGLYNTDPVDICTDYTDAIFLPNERYTSGGETHLNFTSDYRDEGYGFRVTIVQVEIGATQPPTAASTTAVQTVETTTSETTAASTTAAQTTETTLESTTAAQTTKTTAASATVGTTAERTVKSTTSETTAVPATVQSVQSTITASTANSIAAESTEAPHTNPTTVDLGATQPPTAASTTAVQTVETTTSESTAASTTAAQTTETTLESTTAAQTTKTTAASATVGTTAERTVKSTTSETTAVPATVQSVQSTITASTANSTAAESTEAPNTISTTGTQSPSQIDGATEPMNVFIIIIVVISAGYIIPIIVVTACFLKRRKSSQQSSNREDEFQNPISMCQRNEVFSGPRVGEYDQIPADKMLTESQIQNLKNRVGSEGDYESREHHSWEDHTYQGLKEAKGNNAFSEYYNQIDD